MVVYYPKFTKTFAIFLIISYLNFIELTLNRHVLNGKVIKKYCKEFNTNVVSNADLDKYIYNEATASISRRVVRSNKKAEHYLFPTRPRHLNERINAQQGLFVIPSSIEVGFEDILKDYYDDTFRYEMEFGDVLEMFNNRSYSKHMISVLKIEIPKKLKYIITRRNLQRMNMTSEHMYPDLGGLARSMACLRYANGDYDEF